MICPRCDEHHAAADKHNFQPLKPTWCDDCLEELQSGRIGVRRTACEDVLGCLGIGNGSRLDGFDDAADFEAETSGLILQAIRDGVLR